MRADSFNAFKFASITLIILLAFFSIIPVCLSQDLSQEDITNDSLGQELSKIPFLDAKAIQDLQKTIQILQADYSNLTGIENPSDTVMIIQGSDTNAVEGAGVMYVMNMYPQFADMKRLPDDDANYEEAMKTSKTVILIGGPSQNKISARLVDEGVLIRKDMPPDSKFVVFEGKNTAGSKIILFSDERGFENFRRQSAERSPLAKIMPTEAVVAAASFISLLLAFLWATFGGGIRVLIAKLVTGKKKKAVKAPVEAKSLGIGSFRIRYREILAIVIGALAYTTGVTLAITGLNFPLLDVLKLSIFGGFMFFGVREFGRILLCWRKDLNTEYILWWPGAILAVFTGYLGNTLNIPGFVVEHKDKEVEFNKYTSIKYMIVIATFILSIILFISNILNPVRWIQVFAIISSTYAAAEIMPFKPMPGADIFKWRPILFSLSFIIMVGAYILFNFVI